MPTLLNRRYVRKLAAVSRTERLAGVLILLALAALLVGFAVTVWPEPGAQRPAPAGTVAILDDTAATPGLAPLAFPDPGLPGWQAPERARRFAADELEQKIDGRAELFRKYHVTQLVFGTYTDLLDARRAVDVYGYELATPADAAAVFAAERPDDAAVMAIGDDGYAAGGAVFFHSGSVYVQVLPAAADEETHGAAQAIAARVAEQIAIGDGAAGASPSPHGGAP